METRCVLVYATLSGNTEQMALAIASEVKGCGCQLDVKEMYQSNADLLMDYDCILLGSPTWIDGELPDEAMCFYEEMDQLDLRGKTAAVFGSGDRDYDDFGGAVDKLQNKLWERGADVIMNGLKIEHRPNAQDIDVCQQFGKRFVEQSAYYDK